MAAETLPLAAKGGGVSVLEERKLPGGEVLSARGDLICCASVYQQPVFSASHGLMSECFPQGPCKQRMKNAVFFLLVIITQTPPPPPPPAPAIDSGLL